MIVRYDYTALDAGGEVVVKFHGHCDVALIEKRRADFKAICDLDDDVHSVTHEELPNHGAQRL